MTALDSASKAKAHRKVLDWQKAQRNHLAKNPFLPRKYEREAVKGWSSLPSITPKPVPSKPVPSAGKQYTVKDLEKFKNWSEESRKIRMKKQYGENSLIPQCKKDAELLLKSENELMRKALQDYTHSSEQVNYILRTQGVGPRPARGPGDKVGARDLLLYDVDDLIKEKATPMLQDTIVFRHGDRKYLPGMFQDSEVGKEVLSTFESMMYSEGEMKASLGGLRKKLVGSVISEKGYASTSYSNDVFVYAGGYEIQYYLPKGSVHGISLDAISEFPEENEYLMRPGQKWVIWDVDFGGDASESWQEAKSNLVFKVVSESLFKQIFKNIS